MLNKLEDLSAVQAPYWINQEKLLERVGGDQELLESLAGMFPEEVDKGMSSLEFARSANNAKQVQMSAHTLKSICNMFDATVAANAALDLEVTASGGGLGSDTQVDTLRIELVRAVQAVRQLQAGFNQG